MAKITTFVYCEGVERPQDSSNLNIINPIQLLTPMFIPSMYSFSIVVGILDFDTSLENSIRITFKQDVKDELIIDTNTLTIPPQEQKDISLPKNMQGFMANMEFKNVALREAGTYKTTVYFNGVELGEYPISVIEGR